MANLKYKTRGNSTPQGKPRVYFCCHPGDFNRCFESISDEILAKQNCAVWYTDEVAVHDEDFFVDLKQMQLFVMPITTNLLCTENQAIDIEFKFAIENHIPVLPLMQESGLEELFNKRCGDLQFLDKNNADTTAISYDDKLQKYLETVLIGDELAEKIRAAFDAYVFLSYRKKDRRYAQELMRLIHKNEFCRDIAIWYDEFLTPGENFNDSIKEALEKSGLFVLTVTPNLINEQNYIMTTEYPMAKREGKPILPAELVPTDREILVEKYEDIPNPADAHNDTELSGALLESIKKMAIKENDISSEHNFFIGLAYLDGIDVEVDHDRAVSLISASAKDCLLQAIDKLVEMYRNGKGVNRDYVKAIEWQQKKIEKMTRDIELCTDQSKYVSVFDEMLLLGDYYKEISNFSKAEEEYKKAQDFVKRFKQATANERTQVKVCLCEAMGKLGDLLMTQEKSFIQAKHWCQHYVWGYEELFNDTKDERFIEKIAYGYMRWGDAFYITSDYKNAQTCYERCLKYALSLCKKTGGGLTITGAPTVGQLILNLLDLGNFKIEKGKYGKAESHFMREVSLTYGLETGAAPFARQLIFKSFVTLGNLEIEKGEYGLAESYYTKAISLAHEFEKEDSSLKTIDDLIACNNALAKVKLLESDAFMACSFSSKALEYAEKMFNDTNTYYAKTKLLECYCQNARCLIENKRYDAAKRILEKAHQINEDMLLEIELPQTKLRTSDIYECWGDIYSCENNNEQAFSNFKKCTKIRQELCLKECPKCFYEALAKAYCNMGRIYRTYVFDALNVYDILVQSYISMNTLMPKRQFVEIAKIVKDHFVDGLDISSEDFEADDYPNRVVKIYISVADEYMLKGDNSTVYSFMLRATNIKEKLSQKSSSKANKRELAELYLQTADICEKVGELIKSKKYREKGLAILAALSEN